MPHTQASPAMLSGTYAAILTPRGEDGAIDLSAFARQLRAVRVEGIRGVAINGATGEMCVTSIDELQRLIGCVKSTLPETQIFCGIGGADFRTTLERGRLAVSAGVTAMLLPAPWFFPYRQDDVQSYAAAVAEDLRGDLLLYNLPQFTTGYEAATVLSLLRSQRNIVGIKDSSGSLEILRAITAADLPAARLIGNDGALCDAQAEGICDGVVSGVACTLPVLMTRFFSEPFGSARYEAARVRLKDFLQQLETLPTPWGLKAASAAAGLAGGAYPLPLSPQRGREVAALQSWFREWQAEAAATRVNSLLS